MATVCLVSVALALIAMLVALGALAAVQLARRRRTEALSALRPHQRRLHARLAQRRPYRTLVSTRDRPDWSAVVRSDARTLTTEDGTVLAYGDVRGFVVSYAGGELVDEHRVTGGLPAGIHAELDSTTGPVDAPDDDAIRQGARYATVHFGPEVRVDRRAWFATTVRNVSDEPVRIVRFAAFIRTNGRWTLHTVHGGWFTARQFAEWYGVAPDGWIAPGASAVDADNYGASDALWVFHGETRSGAAFVTAAVRPARTA